MIIVSHKLSSIKSICQFGIEPTHGNAKLFLVNWRERKTIVGEPHSRKHKTIAGELRKRKTIASELNPLTGTHIHYTEVMAVERHLPLSVLGNLSAAITWIKWIENQKCYVFLKA